MFVFQLTSYGVALHFRTGGLSFSHKYMRDFAAGFFRDGREAYVLLADSGVTYPNFQKIFTLGDDRYLHCKLSSTSLWCYVYEEYLQLVRINPLVVAEAKGMFPNQADINFVRGSAIAMKKLQESNLGDVPIPDEKTTKVSDTVVEMLDDNDEEETNERFKIAARILPVFRAALLG